MSRNLDKQTCAAEAKKYATRTEFCYKDRSAYGKARTSGWLDDICRHMPKYSSTGMTRQSSQPVAAQLKRVEFLRRIRELSLAG